MGFFAQHAMPIMGLVVLLLVVIIIFQYGGVSTNVREKRISKIVTVEGYTESPGLFPDSENAQAICEIHLENPAIIDKGCKTFSEKNCNTVGCCVWKDGKCVGGTNNRAFYRSD